MIFDNEVITSLVLRWQYSEDPDLLEEILVKCRPLIEAIISSFDYTQRDDLIQEATIKVRKSLDYYDPGISSLHNYLTTVIKNASISWLDKVDHDYIELDAIDDLELPGASGAMISDSTLPSLIAHNRERFPSLPAIIIDDMTEYVYLLLQEIGKNRRIIVLLMKQFGCARYIAHAVYYATLAHLRIDYKDYASVSDDIEQEFSLLPELREALGEERFKTLCIVFSGMTLKIP